MEENIAKKVILVVDDMAAILEHAKQILKDEYSIIPCTSAKMALEIITKRRPDIILTDINMPDMDGYEFLRTVKGNPELKSIPVILTTAELTADIEARGFEMGADDYLLKPFSQITMLRRIKLQLAAANDYQ